MTPWTAVLAAGLGVAILLQSGQPSSVRIALGAGAAVLVGVLAVIFLAEYLTHRSFGLDVVWFHNEVRRLQETFPAGQARERPSRFSCYRPRSPRCGSVPGNDGPAECGWRLWWPQPSSRSSSSRPTGSKRLRWWVLHPRRGWGSDRPVCAVVGHRSGLGTS